MSDQRLPPVLLLHGVCSTGPTLAVLAHAFRRQGCEVAAPTLAAAQRTDTGASDGSLAGLTLSSLLDEAREHAGRLAKHFGTRPLIVGHSNGALLALALAGLGEASAVGLIAPAPPPSVPGAPMWLRRLLFSRVFGPDWDTRAVRFRPRWPLASESPQGSLARSLCPDSGTVMAESLAPGHGGVFNPAPPLPCPVAVVSGSRDKLVPPALARQLAERFDARHHEIQAAGHWLIGDLKHAVTVCSVVLAMLQEVEVGTTE